MTTKQTMPLWAAVLINVNIVVGSAFFLSAHPITQAAGLLAPVAWLACAFLLLPLVITLARLAVRFPRAGGIYVYSKEALGDVGGFVCGWSYYIGTVAANAAVLQAFSGQFQRIPVVYSVLHSVRCDGLIGDLLLLIIFTLFNLGNIEFLERTQIAFTVLKAIPIVCVVLAVPFLGSLSNLSLSLENVYGMYSVLPLVLFAFIGIEACCAVADKIENPSKNVSRAILIAFGIITVICATVQTAMLLLYTAQSGDPFTTIFSRIFSNQALAASGNSFMALGLLASYLAGFYGMFYYNNWNLYAMGIEGRVWGAQYIRTVTAQGIPWVSVLVQSALVAFLLVIGRQSLFLITAGDLGTVIAYGLTAVSAIILFRKKTNFWALGSCGLLLLICLHNLFAVGVMSAIPFLCMLGIGLVGFYYRPAR
jgi:amino acid transporter